MKPEETIDFHIRWAWAKMSRHYNAIAATQGGSMAMGYALLNIDKDGTPATRLGPKMGMEPTSMTRLLRSLEENGYIERRSDASDGRRVLLFLTPTGKQYRDFSRKAVIRLNEILQEKLSANERAVFFRVMEKINRELDKKDIFEIE